MLASLGVSALLLGVSAAGVYPPDVVDKLAAEGIAKLKDYMTRNPSKSGCTVETAVKRKEWSDLTIEERQDYIQAVLCLQSKPAKTASQAPGAKSRFDDYVVVHIQQTPAVHGSTYFLPWHRYYIWHYEKSLREECGYKGYQPYWNWDRYAKDPINSPLFNGNATSMGGNGEKVAHPGVSMPGAPPPYNVIPPAEGGGCVTSGPFKNMTVNLGPIAPSLPNIPRNPRPDGFGHNPRCLRRDVNKNSAAVTTANYTYDLIVNNAHTDRFQTVMEGETQLGHWGVHIGGHYTVGGDPAGDFYVSPSDPVFWLHHGMIDRVWWIWQMQDLAVRLKQVSKTITMMNMPPSRNGTLKDPLNLGVLSGDVILEELMNTIGGMDGKLCYIYE